LAAARRACAAQYPAAVGTFLARATCINEAIDQIALPSAANPDLVQLQESARIALSTKLDDGTISQKTAEATMAEIDAKVANIEHSRAVSDQKAAASQLDVLSTLVTSTNNPRDIPVGSPNREIPMPDPVPCPACRAPLQQEDGLTPDN